MHGLDPDYLPKTVGTLERFVLNPRADIDGLLLTDGTEIHTPPHLSSQLVTALTPGARLTVRGVKPMGGNVIVAVAIDTAAGERIVDEGPGHKHGKPEKHPPHKREQRDKAATHIGKIRCLLHGPNGRPHGVLLVDGVIVRFPPHCAESFADLLAVNGPLSASGHSFTNAQGTVIDAEGLGTDPMTLTATHEHPAHAPKKPKKKPGSKHHDDHV